MLVNLLTQPVIVVKLEEFEAIPLCVLLKRFRDSLEGSSEFSYFNPVFPLIDLLDEKLKEGYKLSRTF